MKIFTTSIIILICGGYSFSQDIQFTLPDSIIVIDKYATSIPVDIKITSNSEGTVYIHAWPKIIYTLSNEQLESGGFMGLNYVIRNDEGEVISRDIAHYSIPLYNERNCKIKYNVKESKKWKRDKLSSFALNKHFASSNILIVPEIGLSPGIYDLQIIYQLKETDKYLNSHLISSTTYYGIIESNHVNLHVGPR